MSKPLASNISFYLSPFEEGLDVEYHTIVGDRLSKSNSSLIYVALIEENQRVKIMVFCGEQIQKVGIKAGDLARDISKSFGGAGGGDARFGQGGSGAKPSVMPDIEGILLKRIPQ
jgi:alanyl-tRNA synthetase